jgi:signal transduction histidine kinase
MDAHHEEIWVKSKYGEYCEFVFTLPGSEEPKHDADKG